MTTAVSVPLTLLWSQAKYLKWLLITLLAGLILAASLHHWDLYYDLYGFGGITPFLFFGFISLFSGVLVFGMEYADGAESYLESRPVSPRLVFTQKVLLIGLICFLSGVAMQIILGPSARPLYSVVGAFYFSLALWCAMFSVLCRDTIRGVLYGGTSFVVLTSMIYFSWDPLTRDTFHVTPGGPFESYNFNAHTYPYASLGILVSPFVVMGIFSVVYRWRRFGNLRMTMAATMGAILFAGYVGFTSWALHTDGQTYFDAGNRRNQSVLSYFVNDESVVYAEISHLIAPNKQVLRIMKIDLKDPEGSSEEVSKTIITHEPVYTNQQPFLHEGYLSSERLVLFGNDVTPVRLFEMDEDYELELIKEYDIVKGVHNQFLIDDHTIFVVAANGYHSSVDGVSDLYLLHLGTGDLEKTERRPQRPEPYVLPLEKNLEYWVKTHHRIDPDHPWKIVHNLPNGATEVVQELGPLHSYVFVEDKIVGFQPDMTWQTHRAAGDSRRRLFLYDLTDPTEPSIIEIEIPIRFKEAYTRLYSFLSRGASFPKPSADSPLPHLSVTFDGETLAL
ncbi:MAG: hypothetical protein KC944_22535, partial [Candidatus Omnitrophica bacterium]|nr:hypothetical protein [Candidatus Omnitrophota bacterium]